MKRLYIIIALVSIYYQSNGQDFTIRWSGTSLGICPNEGGNFTASAHSSTYVWTINESVVSSSQPSALVISNWNYPVGSRIHCTFIENGTTRSSNTLVTTTCVPPVKPHFTVSISIYPTRNTMVYCPGEIYFKANASTGIGQYLWYKNGNSVSSTNAAGDEYKPTSISSSDEIKVVAYASNPSNFYQPSEESILPKNLFSFTTGVTATPIMTFDGISKARCPGPGATQFNSTIANALSGQIHWSVTEAGSSKISDTGLVTWDPDFIGTAKISLNANGACGSTASQIIDFKMLYTSNVTLPQEAPICDACYTVLNSPITAANYDYQWWFNGVPIPAPLGQAASYSTFTEGSYSIAISTPGGCSISNAIMVQKNHFPVINAGPDLIVQTNAIIITGSAVDPEGDPITYRWTQISGDNTIIMSGTTSPALRLSKLKEGSYKFRLYAKDNFFQGQEAYDDIIVTLIYPPNNYNYIISNIPSVDRKTDGSTINESDITSLTEKEKQQSIQYIDGLGRPMQVVNTKGSPDSKDFIQPIVYDEFGRESRKYLPVATQEVNGYYKPNDQIIDNASGAYKGIAQGFYAPGSNNMIADDAKPYAESTYESSSLNRVLKHGAPGSVWQPQSSIQTDKTIKYSYGFNSDSDKILLFAYDDNTGLASAILQGTLKYYGANQLNISQTTDEHQNKVIEFHDREGKLVCKKIQSLNSNGTEKYTSVYYIYNDLGDLVIVYPLETENYIFLSTAESGTFSRDNCIGSVTQSTTYTVQAGKYNSFISQADADQKALDDVTVNGQEYANEHCVCTFYNKLKSQSFSKNDCGPGGTTTGSFIYTVNAGVYSSVVSQQDADDQALNDLSTNGQSYANAHGTCTFLNTSRSSSPLVKNDCLPGSQPSGTVTYTVSQGTYSSTIDQQHADDQAQNDIDINAQAYANANGVCLFYNTTQTQSFTKAGCACGGIPVPYTVNAQTYSSTVSIQDANNKALNEILLNGQANADNTGSCIQITCSGPNKVLIGCECLTFYKSYTSSVYNSSTHRYDCTYHFEYSNGTASGDFTESNINPCALD
jgi:hypothetical protein